ncbi:MAG: non-canonical purine NTP pyrophosphatase [Thermoanaerobaculia bacterium]|nr:non-canonical purine NTP pyrophosphatase [Thermoanaerobaculia bacterium]
MSEAPLLLVTGNAGKLAEARRIVGEGLDAVDLDLPEIQSLDLSEVLRAKAAEAWRRLGRAVVVEETGLYLAALGGFPGPLVKWMLAAVGAEGIARTALALGEARVEARCALLWLDGEREILAEGSTHGRLVLPGRGRRGFGWDPVFQPDGEERTYGELAPEEKDVLGHRGRAWRALLAELRPA